MLEYTVAGDGARLIMLVMHDDAKREYASGPAQGLPDTKIGTFTQVLYDEAKEQRLDGHQHEERLEPHLLFRLATLRPAQLHDGMIGRRSDQQCPLDVDSCRTGACPSGGKWRYAQLFNFLPGRRSRSRRDPAG